LVKIAAETPVTLSAGNYSVVIWTAKLDYNSDKLLTDIPIPRQRNADGTITTGADAFIIDIGRLKRLISVQGFIPDDSSDAAKQKVDDLLTLHEDFREVQITWGTGLRQRQYTGNISKLAITETAGSIADGNQKSGYEQEKNYSVQLAFMIGSKK